MESPARVRAGLLFLGFNSFRAASSVSGRLFGGFADVRVGARQLYLAQARDGVADAIGELLDGLDAAACRVAQLFAQEQLGLSEEAGQRVVDLVARARGQAREL
jgi:hypothetical protein